MHAVIKKTTYQQATQIEKKNGFDSLDYLSALSDNNLER